MENILETISNAIQKYLAPVLIFSAIIMLFWPLKKKEHMDTAEENEFRESTDKNKKSESLVMEGAALRAKRKNSAIKHSHTNKSMCADFIYKFDYKTYLPGRNSAKYISRRFFRQYTDKVHPTGGTANFDFKILTKTNPEYFSQYESELKDRWKGS